MFLQKKYPGLTLAVILAVTTAFTLLKDKPTLFIIGDSTVKNGKGKGDKNMWGWGDLLSGFFNTEQIKVENHALGGTSSRTFLTKGLWDSVRVRIKPGDFVIMQFGHNDGGQLDDTARARGTIKGVGTESKEIYNPVTKKKEVVYTYGWYLRKFIKETKEKGGIALVCSLVPRDSWKDGKVVRDEGGYGESAKKTAETEGAYFIDLNRLTADKYDISGPDVVKAYFPGDHTHTNLDGAKINAGSVAEAIHALPHCPLAKYLLK